MMSLPSCELVGGYWRIGLGCILLVMVGMMRIVSCTCMDCHRIVSRGSFWYRISLAASLSVFTTPEAMAKIKPPMSHMAYCNP